ncbi:MAG TPA: PaaX family transcriptional regulator C-terminal domain-containing protein [Patescibacteria group bacterium]|nr:PaaX family transcriptional regulator C-terminal domain-containing protein [Patescibacteria group bacterium]
MMKLLKKKLLFALNSQAEIGYHPYDFLYFRLSEFESGSVRDAVVRLEKAGAIDKLTRNNRVQMRITNLGREMLTEEIGVLNGPRKPWDGRWRIVVLNGVKNQHHSLLKGLKSLSYRRVARGVYVSPLTVSNATRQLFLDKTWTQLAQIIESRRLILGDDLQWARTLWGLDKLGREYEDFVSLADRLLKISRKNYLLLRQSKGGFKQVFDRYFYLQSADPHLPRQLLPPSWQAEAAKGLFERIVVLAKTAGI